MTKLEPGEYVSVPVAAKLLGVNRQRAWQLVVEGRFPRAVMIGRDWLLPKRDVMRFERLPPGGHRRK